MGLLSDYLEYSRERDNFDPCLYMSPKWERRIDHDYSELKNKKDKSKTYEDLKAVADYLENLINKCLIREKLTRYVLNNGKIESIVTKQTIDLLLREISESLSEAIRALNKVNSQLGISEISNHNDSNQINEKEEKENVKDILLFSLYQYIKNGGPETSSEFRILVSDYAKIINLWTQDNNNKSKDIFKKYLESHYHLRHSQHTCENCGSKMYIDIPFCLNCFEKEKR